MDVKNGRWPQPSAAYLLNGSNLRDWPNFCTLLRIIAGQETADSGHISRDPSLRFGYLPQGLELDGQLTVSKVVHKAAGDISGLEKELLNLAQALAEDPQNNQLQIDYDQMLQHISRADSDRAMSILSAHANNSSRRSAVSKVQLSPWCTIAPLSSASRRKFGGWKTKPFAGSFK